MDRLSTLFQMQQALNAEIVEKRQLQGITPMGWVQKYALALIGELSETLDETQYKWWKTEKPIDEKQLHEELTDMLHFYLSMCLAAGMTADDLFEGYLAKHKENLDRQHGISPKEGYAL